MWSMARAFWVGRGGDHVLAYDRQSPADLDHQYPLRYHSQRHETGYKVFRREVVDGIKLRSNRFNF